MDVILVEFFYVSGFLGSGSNRIFSAFLGRNGSRGKTGGALLGASAQRKDGYGGWREKER
jgi:hypothetical protein